VNLKQIETELEPHLNGITPFEWHIARHSLITAKSHNISQPKGHRSTSLMIALRSLISFFKLLFKALLSESHSFISSNSLEQRQRINSEYYNKLFHQLILNLNKKNISFCYLERSLLQKKKTYDFQYDSLCIDVAAFISSKFIPWALIKSFNPSKFETSKKTLNSLKIIFIYKFIFKFILKNLKVKNLYVSDAYCRFNKGLILAAKELKIHVIEFQHGVIHANHPGYNTYLNYDVSPYTPNELWTFSGSTDCNTIPKLTAIGNYQIDLVRQALKDNPKKDKLLVTLQIDCSYEVTEFIYRSLTLDNYELTLLKRSPSDKIYEPLNKHKNIIFSQNSFYDLLTESQVHITAYSTCAAEALSVGVPNIFINLSEKKAETYFPRIYQDQPSNNYYVSQPDQLLEAIKLAINNNDNNIYSDYFISNHNQHLKKNMERVLNEQ